MVLTSNGISSQEYGFVSCRTGAEKKVVNDLNDDPHKIEAVVMCRSRYRRVCKEVIEEATVMLPGYILFRAESDFPIHSFFRNKRDGIYRVLTDCSNNWQLTGADKNFAIKVFELSGVVQFSKAYFEDDKIRFIDGFLKGKEANVLRVNRRAQTVQIRLAIHNNEIFLWVGYELVNA